MQQLKSLYDGLVGKRLADSEQTRLPFDSLEAQACQVFAQCALANVLVVGLKLLNLLWALGLSAHDRAFGILIDHMLREHLLDLSEQVALFVQNSENVLQVDYSSAQAKGLLVDLHFVDEADLREVVVVYLEVGLEGHARVFVLGEVGESLAECREELALVVLIVLEEKSQDEVGIDQLLLPLELYRPLYVFLQLFPVLEVPDDLLDEQKGVQVVDVVDLEESPSADQAISLEQLEAGLEVEGQFISREGLQQELSECDDFPVAVELAVHQPRIEAADGLEADIGVDLLLPASLGVDPVVGQPGEREAGKRGELFADVPGQQALVVLRVQDAPEGCEELHADGYADLLEVFPVDALVLKVLLEVDEEGRLVAAVVILAHSLDAFRVVQSVLVAQVFLVEDGAVLLGVPLAADDAVISLGGEGVPDSLEGLDLLGKDVHTFSSNVAQLALAAVAELADPLQSVLVLPMEITELFPDVLDISLQGYDFLVLHGHDVPPGLELVQVTI